MTNRQVAILCACIVVAGNGLKYLEFFSMRGNSMWDIANSIHEWLEAK